MKVYIGSTYSDLREYRDAAFQVLKRLGHHVLATEYFAATSIPSIEQCLAAIQESDVYVLIIGYRYGFIPEGFDKSITELEFLEAKKIGIPILVFILSDNAPVRISDIEADVERRAQLEVFKQQLLRDRTINKVESPEDFSVKLAVSISQLDRTKQQETFRAIKNQHVGIRDATSKIEDINKKLIKSLQAESERIVEKTSEEIENYKKVIDDLKAKLRNVVPADPIWRGRKFQTDELFCFSLLPFQEIHFQVYESAIAPAAQELGLRSLHAGEIFGNREIVEDIWDSICSARILIVDVTGRNPNVFYELGICHTLGKDCIIITQNKEDVPFDIRHRRFIEYHPERLTMLKTSLRKTIQTVLSSKSISEEDEVEDNTQQIKN